MNILITPIGKVDSKIVFNYARMFSDIIEMVQKRNPKVPKMAITMDDFSCSHVYEFTGNTTPGNIRCAIVRCKKCKSEIEVMPRIVNAGE